VLRELEFEEQPTAKDQIRTCRYCGLDLPHHPVFGLWVAIRHDAPCGLPCLGGGVKVGDTMHSELCSRCTKRK
jgi:hypothetical protein